MCADALSRVGPGKEEEMKMSKKTILVQAQPSISLDAEVMQLDETEPKWAHGIIRYLKFGELPQDKALAKKVKLHSARHVMIGGILYRKGYTISSNASPQLKLSTS